MEIMITKEQRIVAEKMITEMVCNGYYTIENSFEHKIAQILIDCGTAKILKKKNYGRIHEIAFRIYPRTDKR